MRRIGGFFETSQELILEIKFGEGGEDSRNFVHELFSAYTKYAHSLGISVELLDSSEGHVLAKLRGSKAGSAFAHESGQHCCQRIPITETKGRKQTSFVNVGILPIRKELEMNSLPETELEISTQRGHGKGGQHQNTTDSAVRMKHKPTGLSVFINGRDQKVNRRDALRILTAMVYEFKKSQEHSEFAKQKRETMGSGNRGGAKIRTYNFLESRVVDHRYNLKTSNVKAVMKGDFSLILPQAE